MERPEATMSAEEEGQQEALAVAEEPMITQTQAYSDFSRQADEALAGAVNKGAHLWSRHESRGYDLPIETGTSIFIGRRPDCHIKVENKLVSGCHVEIFRDDSSFRYFVRNHSSNGTYLNYHVMNKGDTRFLQQGDLISLCVCPFSKEDQPIAVYSFYTHVPSRATLGHAASRGGLATSTADTPTGRGSSSGPAAEVSASSGKKELRPCVTGSRLVSEQWVEQHWDTRVVLGAGNFSQVRLGVQIDTSVKRAVKVIDKKKFMQFQHKRESQLSLTSEANVLTSLNHPGIVKAYDWFETDAHLYLVMELLEGGDLLACIMDGGCFRETRARQLFLQIGEAVAYLHARDIVHRDLKPENILLTSRDRNEMRLKIADFGLARKNMRSTDCKTFCGTPHYFAPEVINTFYVRDDGGSAGYGKPCDMWSLGVILYILLSGIPPFEDDDLYKQILEGKYEFDVSEWTSVTEEAKELVKQLMTVNPKDRLTIQQTLEQKWFRFPPMAPSSPPAMQRQALADVGNVVAAPEGGKRSHPHDPVSRVRKAPSAGGGGRMPEGGCQSMPPPLPHVPESSRLGA
jgi:serine/threonine protein kinase